MCNRICTLQNYSHTETGCKSTNLFLSDIMVFSSSCDPTLSIMSTSNRPQKRSVDPFITIPFVLNANSPSSSSKCKYGSNSRFSELMQAFILGEVSCTVRARFNLFSHQSVSCRRPVFVCFIVFFNLDIFGQRVNEREHSLHHALLRSTTGYESHGQECGPESCCPLLF